MFTWLFLFFFSEEIEFIRNAKGLMQVSLSVVSMQKFHSSCMHSRFLVPPSDLSSQHKCH